jgi:hypothetical protein
MNKETIVNNDNIKNNIIKEGSIILNENDFFKDLNNTMENIEFKDFYEKYFRTSIDIKIILLYMKLYETIKLEYKKQNNNEIEKELLAYIIRELMSDKYSRKNILESFDMFFDGKNTSDKKFVLDIFEKKDNGNLIIWNK